MTSVTFTIDGSEWGGYMGCGIIAECGSIRKTYEEGPGEGSSQRAELMALRLALSKLKGDLCLYAVTIKTDSQYVIGILTQNWKPKVHRELVDELREIVAQCGSINVVKIDGESNPAHSLARAGVRKSTAVVDEVDPFAGIPDAVSDVGVTMRPKRKRAIFTPGEVRQVTKAIQTEVREHRTGTGKTEQVVCGSCSGSGAFGSHGICYRCKGKGYQTDADRRRNWGYDKFRSQQAQ